jgi:DNA-binding NtrC family response regulator
MSYNWPGNIRQLENTVFRAVVLADNDMLGIDDFPQIAQIMEGFEAKVPMLPTTVLRPQTGASFASHALSHNEPATNYGSMQLIDDKGELKSLEAMEEETIRFAIDHLNGRMTDVAKYLSIGRSTLYRKLKDYGIDEGHPRAVAE